MAAFYPHITLSGRWRVAKPGHCLADHRSERDVVIGRDLLQPIFDGGRNRGQPGAQSAPLTTNRSPTIVMGVLEAFQQVEDGLSGLALLNQAAKTPESSGGRFARRTRHRHRPLRRRTYNLSRRDYWLQSTLSEHERLANAVAGSADDHLRSTWSKRWAGHGMPRKFGVSR